MIDTLVENIGRLRPPTFWVDKALENSTYFVLTLHRPSNVDDTDTLRKWLTVAGEKTAGHPVIFPVHPRTRKALASLSIVPDSIIIVDPQPYLEFNYLVQRAKGVITDSGGITEETTFLGVPCMTLRDSTERPETVSIGTNEILGTDPKRLGEALERVLAGQWKQGGIPEKWDGQAGERIVTILESLL
jgi:UDP-N-acetylglucosamine 2-epimerase (non-hydrolysing)